MKLKQPRSIAAKDKPLTDEELCRIVPAIYNNEPGPTALRGYQHINTFDVVEALRSLNFGVSMAAQEHTAYPHMAPFAKHVVRMRPLDMFVPPPQDQRTWDYTVPEVIVASAHNTSSALHLMGGLWRFLCLNGLMAGTTLAAFRVTHRQTSVAQQVREAVGTLTENVLPGMAEQVDNMQKKMLKRAQQEQFAAQAIAMRWGAATEAISTDLLLHARREADKGDSVWHTFNRVQENVMQGGFTARNRNRTIKPLTAVGAQVEVNRRLWDAAVALAGA